MPSSSAPSPSFVTRFPPSPTGPLHLGGARTALFNWLYARANGGRFLLRLEDTDRARSTEAFADDILASLDWLGLGYDGPVVRQSERAERHAAAALGLLEQGRAYRCYATAEELAAMREQARAEGRPPRYDRRWRDRSPSEAPANAPFAVRLKAPLSGEMTIEDAVQGPVRLDCAELDDMVLLRGDGSPTYMLSVVADDHDDGVTHIIRGDDHLSNAFRQRALYEALGWAPPVFAHIPLIHGPDGAKLSKRHGAASVLTEREAGVLPEALCNYLLRLGWGKGDMEVLSMAEAARHFTLEGIGRAAARFDRAKLTHLNGLWLRRAEPERLAELIAPALAEALARPLADADRLMLRSALPELQPRAADLRELASGALLYLRAPEGLDAKAAKVVAAAPRPAVEAFARRLEGLAPSDWAPERLELEARDFAEAQGLKLKDLAQPLRAAMSGTVVSPPIFAVMAALGREEALRRLALLYELPLS